MHGYGTYIKSNGDKMMGTFQNDLANGIFKVEYKDGAVYEGNYRKGLKDGKGKFEFPDGNVYKGLFKNNFF